VQQQNKRSCRINNVLAVVVAVETASALGRQQEGKSKCSYQLGNEQFKVEVGQQHQHSAASTENDCDSKINDN